MRPILTIIFILCFCAVSKAQIGFNNRAPDRYNYIDYNLGTENRFRVMSWFVKQKFYGEQGVGVTIENFTNHEINIVMTFTVHGLDGHKQVFDVGCCGSIGLRPKQTKGGEGEWMASSYKGTCTKETGQTWKDKYNYLCLNCISDITINITKVTDVTEENEKIAAAKKAEEEKRLAERKAEEERRIAEKKAEEEKREAAKKLEEEKRKAELDKQAKDKQNQQRQSQYGSSSSSQTTPQNKATPTNSNFSYSTNGSYATVSQNGSTEKVLINTNNLDKTKYSEDQWNRIQQTAETNSKLLEAKKVQEAQRQLQAQKIEEFKQSQQRLAEKYAQEERDRKQRVEQLKIIQQQKEELYQQAATQFTNLAINISNTIAENAARKRAQREAAEREAEERAERIRVREEAERERKALQLEARKSLFSQFPDVKLPLSNQSFGTDDLYFFGYSFDRSQMESDNAIMNTTPVFKIHKYGDGSWPYKNELLEKLAKVNNNKTFNIVGYFIDKSMAEEQRKMFIADAEKYKIVNYEAQLFIIKENKFSSSEKLDYWGNPIKTENN